jgi:hypothetical protein
VCLFLVIDVGNQKVCTQYSTLIVLHRTRHRIVVGITQQAIILNIMYTLLNRCDTGVVLKSRWFARLPSKS